MRPVLAMRNKNAFEYPHHISYKIVTGLEKILSLLPLFLGVEMNSFALTLSLFPKRGTDHLIG